VAKAEWGTKRICLNCGARFYDMNRDPIVCPACSTALDPVAQGRPRRTRAPAKLAAVAAVADPEDVAVEADDDIDTEDDEEVVVAAEDDEDEGDSEEDGESAIEDVSELGDDDMADVIETEIDEDESER
jgi:uncharacterized protein (TIGR02300 family)